MEQYLLGIDNGGSEVKCALFDLAGNEVAKAAGRVAVQMPEPGFTERDPALVWQANAAAVRTLLQKSGVSGEAICAIGLTGYGNGICLVDRAGEAVYPCIVSTDGRAQAYADAFRSNGIGHRIYPKTRQNIWAAQPAALLPWFRDHRPDVLARSAWCLGIKDFIRHRLTGEFVTELTEASSTCLCDLDTRRFDPAIFEALGISDCHRLMPPIALGTDVTGRVSKAAALETGLAPGTPVAGGYFDIDAGAFASGVLDAGTLCLIAGTWSINEYLTPEANRDPLKNKNTLTLSFLPGWFMAEDSSATSASNFDWFVRELLAPDRPGVPIGELFRESDARMEQLVGQDNGVVFVPYLFDSSTVSGAKAAFFNLGGHNTRAHMLQAVYEGVVFSTKLHVENLRVPGKTHAAARLSGGVAKSAVWTQMMADALQMRIEIPNGDELSAKGAAMGAGIAVGLFRDERDAVERMVRLERVCLPDPQKCELYEKKYRNFQRALEALAVFHG